MRKSNRIKNPCRICCQKVTNKTGLQCQGACRKWVHFHCLNYSPGKIQDIKSGILHITCPCPDCKIEINEYQFDMSYSGSNTKYPVLTPLECQTSDCSRLRIKKDQCSGSLSAIRCYNPSYHNIKICDKNQREQFYKFKSRAVQPSNIVLKIPHSSGSQGLIMTDSSYSIIRNRSEPSFYTIDQMCRTVGQLTAQVRDLMCKMKDVLEENRRLKCAGRSKRCHCSNNN